MDDNICICRKLLELLRVGEISDIGINVILLLKKLGFVCTASDGSELECGSFGMIEETVEDGTSNVTCGLLS